MLRRQSILPRHLAHESHADGEAAEGKAQNVRVAQRVERLPGRVSAWLPYLRDPERLKADVRTLCKTETISSDDKAFYAVDGTLPDGLEVPPGTDVRACLNMSNLQDAQRCVLPNPLCCSCALTDGCN